MKKLKNTMYDFEGLQPLLADSLDSIPILIRVSRFFLSKIAALINSKQKVAKHVQPFELVEEAQCVFVLWKARVELLVLLGFIGRLLAIFVQILEHVLLLVDGLELLADCVQYLQQISLVEGIRTVDSKFHDGSDFVCFVHHKDVECLFDFDELDEDLRCVDGIVHVVPILVAQNAK